MEHWLEREIAPWVHHEGSIRRPIAPWANALTVWLWNTQIMKEVSHCYTSRGALVGTRNSSMGPPWRIDPTTHRTMSERSYRMVMEYSDNERGKPLLPVVVEPGEELGGVPVLVRSHPLPVRPQQVRFVVVDQLVQLRHSFTLQTKNISDLIIVTNTGFKMWVFRPFILKRPGGQFKSNLSFTIIVSRF